MSEAGARTRPRAGTGEREKGGRSEGSGARKLAEWVSLGVSLVLIAGLAGLLLYQAFQRDTPYAPAEGRADFAAVARQGDTYILPIEVANRGRRTVRDLKLDVTYTSPEGKEESRELQVDYLAERSTQRVYVYFEQDPRALGVKVEPQSYLLD